MRRRYNTTLDLTVTFHSSEITPRLNQITRLILPLIAGSSPYKIQSLRHNTPGTDTNIILQRDHHKERPKTNTMTSPAYDTDNEEPKPQSSGTKRSHQDPSEEEGDSKRAALSATLSAEDGSVGDSQPEDPEDHPLY